MLCSLGWYIVVQILRAILCYIISKYIQTHKGCTKLCLLAVRQSICQPFAISYVVNMKHDDREMNVTYMDYDLHYLYHFETLNLSCYSFFIDCSKLKYSILFCN